MSARIRTRRVYGRAEGGRIVYEALRELTDRRGHVIGVGELFTLSPRGAGRGGIDPACHECKPFTVALGSVS